MVKKATMKDIGGEPNLQIDEMFAFVAVSEKGEGVMGADMMIDGRLCFVPLVGADMARVEQLVPLAKKIQEEMNQPFKIYKFGQKEDITDQVMGD
jgi:hypothetical protein